MPVDGEAGVRRWGGGGVHDARQGRGRGAGGRARAAGPRAGVRPWRALRAAPGRCRRPRWPGRPPRRPAAGSRDGRRPANRPATRAAARRNTSTWMPTPAWRAAERMVAAGAAVGRRRPARAPIADDGERWPRRPAAGSARSEPDPGARQQHDRGDQHAQRELVRGAEQRDHQLLGPGRREVDDGGADGGEGRGGAGDEGRDQLAGGEGGGRGHDAGERGASATDRPWAGRGGGGAPGGEPGEQARSSFVIVISSFVHIARADGRVDSVRSARDGSVTER